MKLYKLLRLRGDHGVSVFPPEDKELPVPEELAGEPWSENFRKLRGLGYTDKQIGWMLSAWAYHAKYHLNQAEQGIRFFVNRCVAETYAHKMPPEPLFWGIVLGIAVIVAVGLGLYAWAVLDQEKGLTWLGHRWAYLMSYDERFWQAEIRFVAANQQGVYERGGAFGSVVWTHDRNVGGKERKDWIWLRSWRVVLKGRKLIFYHVYHFTGFYVHYCGLLTHLSSERYKLKQGGSDPFKPTGRWVRPGGFWGTPEYKGCWQEWWWL